ncbi:MAG: hypothetical protein JWM25_1600 [Thermoleophilia bacterium]|nr:hypothetical protein [Thermoleophilia bacterium]
MTNRDHEQPGYDELAELLVPYALGQLDPADSARIKDALETNEALRTELREIEAVSATLAGSFEPVAAPPALRSRVLDAVAVAARPHPATVPMPRATQPARRRWRFALPALAGGFATACIVLGVVAINLDGELDDTRSELRQATEAPRGGGAPAGFEDSTVHTVSTSGEMAEANGSLIHVGGDQWLLVLSNVPDPGDGNSWQVWTRDSAGAIDNVAQWLSGGSTQVLTLDRGDIEEVMVSFERSTSAVPAPTTAPVADVTI